MFPIDSNLQEQTFRNTIHCDYTYDSATKFILYDDCRASTTQVALVQVTYATTSNPLTSPNIELFLGVVIILMFIQIAFLSLIKK